MPFNSVASPARFINPSVSFQFFGGFPVPVPTGCISYWNAAFNPIIFKIQRQDYKVISINEAYGNGDLLLVSVDPINNIGYNLATLAYGDKVYLNCDGYVGYFMVINPIDATSFVVEGEYKGNAQGFVNLHSVVRNYRFQVVIGTFENNTFTPISTTSFTPGKDFIATINPMKWLQSVLFCDNNFKYKTLNEIDKNLSRPYRIGITEIYSNQPGAIPAYTYYTNYNVTNSAKQLQDKLGQNMGKYVPIMNQQLLNNSNFISGADHWGTTGVGTVTLDKGYPSVTLSTTSDASIDFINSQLALTEGQEYLLIYSIKITGQANFRPFLGSNGGLVRTTSGVYAERITAAAPGNLHLEMHTVGVASVEIDYVTVYLADDIPEKYCALFLSEFKRPTYWSGYPFDLQFIYSEYIAPFKVVKVEEINNLNRNVIARNEFNLNVTQAYYINRLTLDAPYTEDIKTVDVWLEVGDDAATNCYINDGYVDEEYVDCMPTEDLTNLQIVIETIPLNPAIVQLLQTLHH